MMVISDGTGRRFVFIGNGSAKGPTWRNHCPVTVGAVSEFVAFHKKHRWLEKSLWAMRKI